MLNRRHLRIRVLQFLYSWNKSNESDLVVLEKQFLKSLNKVESYILSNVNVYYRSTEFFAENYIEDSK